MSVEIYNAAKEWSNKHLSEIPNQEVDDIAMVWEAAIKWYQNKISEL